MREPNTEKLNALVGKLVGDLGAAATVGYGMPAPRERFF